MRAGDMGCWWIFTFLHVASYLSDLLFIFDDEMLEAFGFVVCAGYNFFAIHMLLSEWTTN